MKGLIISLCIASAIVTGSAVYANHTKSVSAELGKINASVMESLAENDFDGAAAKIDELKEYLDKKRTVLSATDNHEELDKIEMNIAQMSGFTEGGRQIDAAAHCKTLAFLFEHLPKNYELRLGNIL